jgi:hypothetical protein
VHYCIPDRHLLSQFPHKFNMNIFILMSFVCVDGILLDYIQAVTLILGIRCGFFCRYFLWSLLCRSSPASCTWSSCVLTGFLYLVDVVGWEVDTACFDKDTASGIVMWCTLVGCVSTERTCSLDFTLSTESLPPTTHHMLSPLHVLCSVVNSIVISLTTLGLDAISWCLSWVSIEQFTTLHLLHVLSEG